MVKQTDIFLSINKLLVEAFPNFVVYVQDCPKDFKRPSFLIEFVRLSQIDVCRQSVEKTIYLTITCFNEKDKYGRSDMEKLADIQDTVLQLFLKGYVMVEDRAIKVKSSAGGMDTDMAAYIYLQFEYFDNRTDEEDQTPLAASVNTRIKEV